MFICESFFSAYRDVNVINHKKNFDNNNLWFDYFQISGANWGNLTAWPHVVVLTNINGLKSSVRVMIAIKKDFVLSKDNVVSVYFLIHSGRFIILPTRLPIARTR